MSNETTQSAFDHGAEPAERANLHVVNVGFRTAEPTQDMLDSFGRLPSNAFLLLQMAIPKPEASITMKNVGKYKTRGLYMVKTEIVLSSPMLGKEGELFDKARWQTGGLVGQDEWYPGDLKIVHARYDQPFDPLDWPAIKKGEKGFYVLAKSIFCDLKGPVTQTESCTYWWYDNHAQKYQPCWTHNN